MGRRPKAEKEGKTRKGLTPKETALVEAFLVTRNKSLSWVMAGYDASQRYSTAYHVFGRPHVRAAIVERLEQNKLTVDVALSVLADHATGNLDPFIKIEEAQDPLDASKKIRYHVVDIDRAKELRTLGIVKKIWNTRYGVGIELHDPVKAIEVYAKISGWIVENGPGKAPTNNDGIFDDNIDRRAAAQQ